MATKKIELRKNEAIGPAPTEWGDMMAELKEAMVMADAARHLNAMGTIVSARNTQLAQKALRLEAFERIYRIGARLAEIKELGNADTKLPDALPV